MRVGTFAAFILSLVAGTRPLTATQAKDGVFEPLYFTALTDPACPVAGYPAPVPSAKEVHVLYFPMGKKATIKESKSLVLHIVFDYGMGPDDNQTLPFARRDDGVWLATIALKGNIPKFGVYWIEDPETKRADTNGGRYFDVPFCDPHGRRFELGVMFEAMSYTGKLESYGIERPVDYAKAIEVLEGYIHAPSRGQNLISSLWGCKLHVLGDTAEGHAALLAEINEFIRVHSADGFGLIDALNFTAYQDWIPADTVERLIAAIENKNPDYNPRAFVLQVRAFAEKDAARQIALQWEIVDKYPDSLAADNARRFLMVKVIEGNQRERVYRELRAKNPHDAFLPLDMAISCLEANQSLPDALALLGEADRQFDESAQGKQSAVRYSESMIKDGKLRIAIARAEVLVRLGKFADALAILLPLKSEFHLGSSYYALGEALEGTGDRKGAVDAYLEGAVRPWKDQRQSYAALERLWLHEKMGNKGALLQLIEARNAKNFSNANYVPRLLRTRAPEFDVMTLHGEHFTNSQLHGKTVILNFWEVWCAPCLWELHPLQDFQDSHPEVVVLTVVDTSTDAKQLEDIIQTGKLTHLRISKASPRLREEFGGMGVPNTVVIDEAGNVRIHHVGGIPDVSRYLGADLKAIADAGAPEQNHSGSVATRN